jgi:hypothetical protein
MRTGCDHLAEAQLSYDPVNCHAWIDVLLPEPGPAQELCGLHAANLKVPQGWECEDRRQLAFAPSPAAPSPAAPSPSAPSPSAPSPSAVEPEVAARPEPEVAVEPEVAARPEPEEEPARVSEPKPARAKAKSKPKPSLLSRALKTTGPQRSALSEELGAPSSSGSSSTDTSSTN